EANLVLELPARRQARRRIGQAEQQARVPGQRAGADVENLAEELGSRAIVLCIPAADVPEFTGRSVELKAGLDHESIVVGFQLPGIDPGLEGVGGVETSGRIGADLFFQKQIDSVAEPPKVLAQHRTELDRVRFAVLDRMAVLGEEAGIEPILAALAEL